MAEQTVAKLAAKDQAGLRALACDDAEPDVQTAIDNVEQITSAKLVGDVTAVDDAHATAKFAVSTTDGEMTYVGELTRQGEKWCWSGVAPESSGTPPDEPGTPPSEPTGPGGETGPDGTPRVVTEFVEKLNAGDTKGVESLFCEGSFSILVEDMVERDAK
ncbi:MAG: hypothetical protein ACRDQB_00145, partial [Thermocrispum sp.]